MSARSRVPLAFAAFFAGLHVLLVAVPVIDSWGSGEGQGMAAGIFDFPLVIVLNMSAAGRRIGGGCSQCSMTPYVLIFSVVGTFMWATIGFAISASFQWAWQTLRRAFRSN